MGSRREEEWNGLPHTLQNLQINSFSHHPHSPHYLSIQHSRDPRDPTTHPPSIMGVPTPRHASSPFSLHLLHDYRSLLPSPPLFFSFFNHRTIFFFILFLYNKRIFINNLFYFKFNLFLNSYLLVTFGWFVTQST